MSTRGGPIAAVDTSSTAGLGPVIEAGGPELARLLSRTESRLGEVIESYGDRLAEHAAGTLAAGGKRLRPTLVYLCAGAAGGPDRGAASLSDSKAGTAVVHAGAAVELLHMATLVHDDVLDRAALRRGQPTVFRSGGRVGGDGDRRPALLPRLRRARHDR